jgi:hypothetical protein
MDGSPLEIDFFYRLVVAMTIWFLNGNYKEMTKASVIIDDRTNANRFLR